MEKRYQYCRSSSSLMSSYNDAHRSAINISSPFLHRRHFRGLFILFYVFYVCVCVFVCRCSASWVSRGITIRLMDLRFSL